MQKECLCPKCGKVIKINNCELCYGTRCPECNMLMILSDKSEWYKCDHCGKKHYSVEYTPYNGETIYLCIDCYKEIGKDYNV